MFASNLQTQTTVRNEGGPVYLLIMDARGNPLALSPIEKLQNSNFPIEQMRLVDVKARMLPTGDNTARALVAKTDPAFDRQVESALQRLYDLAFLCEHPLAQLPLVTSRMAQRESANCLDRARILRGLLQEAIEQLRPNGAMPASTVIPRREWHLYLILHRAYIEGELNNWIMSWLQISEGTFNRTRRRALQSVAKVLMELELQAG